MECLVCVELFNRSNRLQVQCNFCEFIACRECCKKYLMSSLEDAHCMSCRKAWDRKMLLSKFEKIFVEKQYKKKREEILYEREKGLMPSTQPYVEREILLERMNTEIAFLYRELDHVMKQIENLKIQRQLIYGRCVEEKRVFMRPCSRNNCKGFLSTQWKCGICEYFTCPECLEVKGVNKDDEHKCDPNNIETAKLLKKDTKLCPKCGTSIFKIEGCDQMFCTQCHTPFSWTTGKIENGKIHNPHYFEWLRSQGKVPDRQGEILCGREIDGYFVRNLSKTFSRLDINNKQIPVFEKSSTMLRACENLIHLYAVEIPRFNIDIIRDNLQLRINFMRNKLSEDELKTILQRRDKDIQKRTEIRNVLIMFYTCCTDLFYRINDLLVTFKSSYTLNTTEWLGFEGILDEFGVLLEYANSCLYNISTVYKCKQYSITTTFRFV